MVNSKGELRSWHLRARPNRRGLRNIEQRNGEMSSAPLLTIHRSLLTFYKSPSFLNISLMPRTA